jgi:hypothetical protein
MTTCATCYQPICDGDQIYIRDGHVVHALCASRSEKNGMRLAQFRGGDEREIEALRERDRAGEALPFDRLDKFAAAALKGILANHSPLPEVNTESYVATWAYDYAEAMIAERARRDARRKHAQSRINDQQQSAPAAAAATPAPASR